MLSLFLSIIFCLQANQPAQIDGQFSIDEARDRLYSLHQANQQASQVRIEKVRDNVYSLYGANSNMGLIVGEDCLVLVDNQFERTVPAMMTAIKTVSDKPIRYIINTHQHSDHVGGNRVLAADAYGIIAHANTKAHIERGQARLEPERRGGLPNLLLGKQGDRTPASMSISLGNQDIQVEYFGPCHSDGDVAVLVPSAKVAILGDMLFLDQLHYIELATGGSCQGLIDVIGQLLTLLPYDTMVIPGHGQVCDMKELARHRTFLQTALHHARSNPDKTARELAESFDKEPWKDKEPAGRINAWTSFFNTVKGPQS